VKFIFGTLIGLVMGVLLVVGTIGGFIAGLVLGLKLFGDEEDDGPSSDDSTNTPPVSYRGTHATQEMPVS
jgi:hypothetical protein